MDMAGALDLLDVYFKAIALDGSLLLDDDHMMTIVDTLENRKCFSLLLLSWYRRQLPISSLKYRKTPFQRIFKLHVEGEIILVCLLKS
jgi:hypothetical protein